MQIYNKTKILSRKKLQNADSQRFSCSVNQLVSCSVDEITRFARNDNRCHSEPL